MYEAMGQAIGKLVEEKQAAYGDSFGKSGDVLRVLYRKGSGRIRLTTPSVSCGSWISCSALRPTRTHSGNPRTGTLLGMDFWGRFARNWRGSSRVVTTSIIWAATAV